MCLARIASTVVVLVLGFVTPAAAGADTSDELWKSFRNAFPTHIQTLALSPPDSSGARTLIIAEPPPDTLPKREHKERLAAIFRDHLQGTRIKRHDLALHGWAEDIVVTLSGYKPTGDDRLQDDLGYLAQLLWGTSYKFAPLALPVRQAPAPWKAPQNLDIRHSELREWLVDGKLRFVPVTLSSAAPATVAELMDSGRTGAFMSAGARGVVLLLIDRRRNFEEFRADFRKFAIDSDVVFGAVAIGDHLAIVAREREAAAELMPPLRFETAHLVATTKEPELAQSYERNQLFAGRLEDGEFKGADWAPIYLSPQLVNTEFGSTLNITDQMLKSWSSAGLVDYHRFNYARPPRFPFGGKPIMAEARRLEPKINQTLFNWNTTGAFSLASYEPPGRSPEIRVLNIQNTGSLPMIYKDESQPAFDHVFADFERKGYEYFKTLRDPLLARVTSYQLIFQATRDRPLPTAKPPRSVAMKPPEGIRPLAATLVQQIPDMSGITEEDLKALCTITMLLGEVASIEECETAVALRFLSAEVFRLGSERVRERLVDVAIDRNADRQISELEQERAINIISKMEQGPVSIPRDLENTVAALAGHWFMHSARVLGEVGDEDRLKAFELYAKSKNEDPDSYIRTPTVVVSRNGEGAVGGHNLSGNTTGLVADAATPRGTARIIERNGEKVLAVNPADMANAGAAARAYAKQTAAGADRPAVMAELQKALAQRLPAREFRTALQFERPGETGRGMIVAAKAEVEQLPAVGYRTAAADAARLQQTLALAKELELSVVVSKINNEFVVVCVYCPSGQEIRALSHVALRESVVDAMHQAPAGLERRLYFDKFTREEVEAFRRTMEFGAGSPPPPFTPRPNAAGAGGEPPWHRSGGGNGPNASPGGMPQLVFLRSPARRGHQIEVQVKEGGVLRPARANELKEAYRQLDQPGEWSRAKIEPIAAARADGKATSFEVMVPFKSSSGSGTEPIRGRLEIRWNSASTPVEQQRVISEAKRQLMQSDGPFRHGIEKLIERLRGLKVGRNVIADVKFFFTHTIFDGILTEDLSAAVAAGNG